MFRKSLDEYEGIILAQPRSDRVDSSIHMFFMNFDIAVVWTDPDFRIVDIQYARRWRPYYAPKKAAKYVVEMHPNRLKDFQTGDQLAFKNV